MNVEFLEREDEMSTRRGKKIRILVPDNWHCHLRELLMLYFMLKYSIESGFFSRILVMPNTNDPILDYLLAKEYERKIWEMAATLPFKVPKTLTFVMTIQITEKTTPEMIYAAWENGVRVAKVYARDVTTNSSHGVRRYKKIYPALRAAEKCGMYICFHAEHPSQKVEGKDKEIRFLEDILVPILIAFPNLKVTVEHISTAYAVTFVRYWHMRRGKIIATITAHHLYLTQGDVIGYTKRTGYKVNVHHACKPMIEWGTDREALQDAATSGEPCFCYGGDDAPHTDKAKYCIGGACGDFNTPVALAILAEVFEKRQALRNLSYFVAVAGALHYGYPLRKKYIVLEKRQWRVPKQYPVEGTNNFVVPTCAGWFMKWKLIA